MDAHRTPTDADHASRRAAEERHPTLVIAFHPEPAYIGRNRTLEDGEVLLIGRNSRVLGAGALNDTRVSREHAEVRRSGDDVRIRDLESRNSTWVNGEPITTATLAPGDVIEIGDLVLVVQFLPVRWFPPRHPRLVGISAALAGVLAQVDQVAQGFSTVLLLGETGTGRELVAREIHEGSGRSGPFVALDCGGLPDDLVHSELFGHVEGAFPGADRDQTGLLEAARGGTLFLNEIGGASLVLQGNLLRFLEEGAARPLGSDRAIQSDARVIVSTDRSLRELVEAGSFREDLLARLSRGEILVPPLRERREDIVPLATYFARRYTDGPVVLSRALAVALLIQPWPGNVRELQGVVERAAVEGVEEDRVELTPWVEEVLRPEVDDGTSPLVGTEPRARPEPEVLVAALRARVGNVSVAATDLGVSRSTLYRWMRDARIDLERLSYEWEDLTDPWP